MISKFAQPAPPQIHNPKVGIDFSSSAPLGAAKQTTSMPTLQVLPPHSAAPPLAANLQATAPGHSCNVGLKTICSGEKKVQHTGVDELTEALRGLSLDAATWHRLAAMVQSDDSNARAEGVEKFRLLLSVTGEIRIQEVVDCGVVPAFVKFVNDYMYEEAFSSVVFNAAWALTNIASGNPEQTEVVVKNGCISSFLRLLDLPTELLREQGMWGLGNITGDRHSFRDEILGQGAIFKILSALKRSQKVDTIRTGVWTISNLCRGKPRPPFAQVKGAVPYLASIVRYSTDPSCLCDACWALDGIGESSGGVSAILQSGILGRLMHLMIDHRFPTVQRPALRIAGQIATGSAIQTQALIAGGIIPLLIKLLRSNKMTMRKDACWTVSNIAAGTKDQLQALIQHGAFPILVEMFNRDDEIEVRKEASWAITNAVTNASTIQDESHLEHLIRIGCVTPVCEILQVDESRILEVALDALKNLLCFGIRRMSQLGLACNPCAEMIINAGGVMRLLSLQKTAEARGNFDVWAKSGKILQSHFAGCL